VLQTTFMARLYRSPLIIIACCTGYVPGGGCGLALCCDYRIMTPSSEIPNSTIGLNEVQIGLPVPKYWTQLFLKTIGSSGRGEFNLLSGRMVTSEEALKIGLCHEVVSQKDLVRVGEERMTQWLNVADKGRQLTKGLLREEFSREWEAYGPEEAELGWSQLSSPEMISSLEAAMKELFSKGKSSKL
jgi:Delta3-Delta2-enoyl-CoA isomerase